MKMNTLHLFFITIIIIVLAATITHASWLGPEDTHDELSLWLRKMKATSWQQRVKESTSTISILSTGAVPTNDSFAACQQNGKALLDALQKANASTESPKPVVIVPAGQNFWYVPHDTIANIVGVTLQLDGNISLWYKNQSMWPASAGSAPGRCRNGGCGCKLCAFELLSCTDVSFVGKGSILGNGFDWW